MPGPWEQYQAQPADAGPWSQYKASPPPANRDAPISMSNSDLRAAVATTRSPQAQKATTAAKTISDFADTAYNTLGLIGRSKIGGALAILPHSDQARAMGQGTSMGFGDEIKGGLVRAGTAIANTVAPGRLGFTTSDAGDAMTSIERDKQDQFAQDHPVQNVALQTLGAAPLMDVGSGFIAGAKGGGLIASTGRAAVVGGTAGAVSGAGNTDGGLIDRTKGAVRGGIIGAVTGAALPVAARTAVGIVRRGAGAVSGAADAVMKASGRDATTAAVTPAQAAQAQGPALDYVNNLVQRAGKSVDDLAANPIEQAGKPITAAEAIGRSGTYQLGAIGKRAGTTADALEATLETRRADAPGRILGDVSDTLGVAPDAARGDVESVVNAGRAKAGPLYDAALNNPGPVINDDLASVAKRPVVRKAISSVAEDMLNEGKDPTAVGIVKRVEQVPGGGTRDVYGSVDAPTAQTWDSVKKAISKQVERHPLTGKPLPDSVSQGNYGVRSADQALTGAMKSAIPGYGDALSTSGDYLSVQSAFDRAKGTLLRSNVAPADFAKMWSGFSPGEQDAARASIANDVSSQAQNGRLSPRLFSTPAVQAKLTTAFGADKAQALVARLEQERVLAKGYRMQPGTNSVTGESVMADEPQGQGLMGKAVVQGVTGDHRGLINTAGRAITEAIAAPIRGARTAMSQATRDEVGRLLQLPPSELAAALKARGAVQPRAFPGSIRSAGVIGAAAGGYGISQ